MILARYLFQMISFGPPLFWTVICILKVELILLVDIRIYSFYPEYCGNSLMQINQQEGVFHD
ncbi:MAG TPA: hypothetical protein DEB50_11030 [Desulfobacter sp.]|nr:hypothetical protein [Desulfobacter sp.]